MALAQVLHPQAVGRIANEHGPQRRVADRAEESVFLDAEAPQFQAFDKVHRAEIAEPGLRLRCAEDRLNREIEDRLGGSDQRGLLHVGEDRRAHVGDVEHFSLRRAVSHGAISHCLRRHLERRNTFLALPKDMEPSRKVGLALAQEQTTA